MIQSELALGKIHVGLCVRLSNCTHAFPVECECSNHEALDMQTKRRGEEKSSEREWGPRHEPGVKKNLGANAFVINHV